MPVRNSAGIKSTRFATAPTIPAALDCGTDFPNSDIHADIDTIDRKTTLHYLLIFKPDRCWDRLFTFHRFFGTDFSYEIVNLGWGGGGGGVRPDR